MADFEGLRAGRVTRDGGTTPNLELARRHARAAVFGYTADEAGVAPLRDAGNVDVFVSPWRFSPGRKGMHRNPDLEIAGTRDISAQPGSDFVPGHIHHYKYSFGLDAQNRVQTFVGRTDNLDFNHAVSDRSRGVLNYYAEFDARHGANLLQQSQRVWQDLNRGRTPRSTEDIWFNSPLERRSAADRFAAQILARNPGRPGEGIWASFADTTSINPKYAEAMATAAGRGQAVHIVAGLGFAQDRHGRLNPLDMAYKGRAAANAWFGALVKAGLTQERAARFGDITLMEGEHSNALRAGGVTTFGSGRPSTSPDQWGRVGANYETYVRASGQARDVGDALFAEMVQDEKGRDPELTARLNLSRALALHKQGKPIDEALTFGGPAAQLAHEMLTAGRQIRRERGGSDLFLWTFANSPLMGRDTDVKGRWMISLDTDNVTREVMRRTRDTVMRGHRRLGTDAPKEFGLFGALYRQARFALGGETTRRTAGDIAYRSIPHEIRRLDEAMVYGRTLGEELWGQRGNRSFLGTKLKDWAIAKDRAEYDAKLHKARQFTYYRREVFDEFDPQEGRWAKGADTAANASNLLMIFGGFMLASAAPDKVGAPVVKWFANNVGEKLRTVSQRRHSVSGNRTWVGMAAEALDTMVIAPLRALFMAHAEFSAETLLHVVRNSEAVQALREIQGNVGTLHEGLEQAGVVRRNVWISHTLSGAMSLPNKAGLGSWDRWISGRIPKTLYGTLLIGGGAAITSGLTLSGWMGQAKGVSLFEQKEAVAKINDYLASNPATKDAQVMAQYRVGYSQGMTEWGKRQGWLDNPLGKVGMFMAQGAWMTAQYLLRGVDTPGLKRDWDKAHGLAKIGVALNASWQVSGLNLLRSLIVDPNTEQLVDEMRKGRVPNVMDPISAIRIGGGAVQLQDRLAVLNRPGRTPDEIAKLLRNTGATQQFMLEALSQAQAQVGVVTGQNTMVQAGSSMIGTLFYGIETETDLSEANRGIRTFRHTLSTGVAGPFMWSSGLNFQAPFRITEVRGVNDPRDAFYESGEGATQAAWGLELGEDTSLRTYMSLASATGLATPFSSLARRAVGLARGLDPAYLTLMGMARFGLKLQQNTLLTRATAGPTTVQALDNISYQRFAETQIWEGPRARPWRWQTTQAWRGLTGAQKAWTVGIKTIERGGRLGAYGAAALLALPMAENLGISLINYAAGRDNQDAIRYYQRAMPAFNAALTENALVRYPTAAISYGLRGLSAVMGFLGSIDLVNTLGLGFPRMAEVTTRLWADSLYNRDEGRTNLGLALSLMAQYQFRVGLRSMHDRGLRFGGSGTAPSMLSQQGMGEYVPTLGGFVSSLFRMEGAVEPYRGLKKVFLGTDSGGFGAGISLNDIGEDIYETRNMFLRASPSTMGDITASNTTKMRAKLNEQTQRLAAMGLAPLVAGELVSASPFYGSAPSRVMGVMFRGDSPVANASPIVRAAVTERYRMHAWALRARSETLISRFTGGGLGVLRKLRGQKLDFLDERTDLTQLANKDPILGQKQILQLLPSSRGALSTWMRGTVAAAYLNAQHLQDMTGESEAGMEPDLDRRRSMLLFDAALKSQQSLYTLGAGSSHDAGQRWLPWNWSGNAQIGAGILGMTGLGVGLSYARRYHPALNRLLNKSRIATLAEEVSEETRIQAAALDRLRPGSTRATVMSWRGIVNVIEMNGQHYYDASFNPFDGPHAGQITGGPRSPMANVARTSYRMNLGALGMGDLSGLDTLSSATLRPGHQHLGMLQTHVVETGLTIRNELEAAMREGVVKSRFASRLGASGGNGLIGQLEAHVNRVQGIYQAIQQGGGTNQEMQELKRTIKDLNRLYRTLDKNAVHLQNTLVSADRLRHNPLIDDLYQGYQEYADRRGVAAEQRMSRSRFARRFAAVDVSDLRRAASAGDAVHQMGRDAAAWEGNVTQAVNRASRGAARAGNTLNPAYPMDEVFDRLQNRRAWDGIVDRWDAFSRPARQAIGLGVRGVGSVLTYAFMGLGVVPIAAGITMSRDTTLSETERQAHQEGANPMGWTPILQLQLSGLVGQRMATPIAAQMARLSMFASPGGATRPLTWLAERFSPYITREVAAAAGTTAARGFRTSLLGRAAGAGMGRLVAAGLGAGALALGLAAAAEVVAVAATVSLVAFLGRGAAQFFGLTEEGSGTDTFLKWAAMEPVYDALGTKLTQAGSWMFHGLAGDSQGAREMFRDVPRGLMNDLNREATLETLTKDNPNAKEHGGTWLKIKTGLLQMLVPGTATTYQPYSPGMSLSLRNSTMAQVGWAFRGNLYDWAYQGVLQQEAARLGEPGSSLGLFLNAGTAGALSHGGDFIQLSDYQSPLYTNLAGTTEFAPSAPRIASFYAPQGPMTSVTYRVLQARGREGDRLLTRHLINFAERTSEQNRRLVDWDREDRARQRIATGPLAPGTAPVAPVTLPTGAPGAARFEPNPRRARPGAPRAEAPIPGKTPRITAPSAGSASDAWSISFAPVRPAWASETSYPGMPTPDMGVTYPTRGQATPKAQPVAVAFKPRAPRTMTERFLDYGNQQTLAETPKSLGESFLGTLGRYWNRMLQGLAWAAGKIGQWVGGLMAAAANGVAAGFAGGTEAAPGISPFELVGRLPYGGDDYLGSNVVARPTLTYDMGTANPNQNVYAQGTRPVTHLVLHHTGRGSFQSLINTLSTRNAEGPVSVHYLLGANGELARLVPESNRAWHAYGANDNTIGIEIQNPGDGKTPYTESQYKQLAQLVASLMHTYSVPLSRVIAHGNIKASREYGRTDPVGLDWGRVAREVKLLGGTSRPVPPMPMDLTGPAGRLEDLATPLGTQLQIQRGGRRATVAMTANLAAFLAVLAYGESGGRVDGKDSFSSYNAHNPSGAHGRYQFMPGTARGRQAQLGVSGMAHTTQDLMAVQELANDSASSFNRLLQGNKLTFQEFRQVSHAYASVWRALPTLAGGTYQDQHARNNAAVSAQTLWTEYERAWAKAHAAGAQPTGAPGARALSTARQYLGYGEQGNRHMLFGREFGERKTSEAWCAYFVSWVMRKAGFTDFQRGSRLFSQAFDPQRSTYDKYVRSGQPWTDIQFGWVPVLAEGFAKKGLAELGRPKTVHAGDIFFIAGSGVKHGHTGFVVSYDPRTGRVKTLEGNSHNQVREGEYSISQLTGVIHTEKLRTMGAQAAAAGAAPAGTGQPAGVVMPVVQTATRDTQAAFQVWRQTHPNGDFAAYAREQFEAKTGVKLPAPPPKAGPPAPPPTKPVMATPPPANEATGTSTTKLRVAVRLFPDGGAGYAVDQMTYPSLDPAMDDWEDIA